MFEMAFKTYKARTKLCGFFEERFIALLRCGNLSQELKFPWSKSLSWYMKAFDLVERVEPLLEIAIHYINEKKFKTAWWFLKIACDLEYPSHCALFVATDDYSYRRWHLLGIASFYCNKFHDGEKACREAIRQKNLDIDKTNLTFYLKQACKSCN
jgi:hypothetical protein